MNISFTMWSRTLFRFVLRLCVTVALLHVSGGCSYSSAVDQLQADETAVEVIAEAAFVYVRTNPASDCPDVEALVAQQYLDDAYLHYRENIRVSCGRDEIDVSSSDGVRVVRKLRTE